MKAVFFHGKDHPVVVKDTYKPIPSAKQVLVRLHNAAINRRDLWILNEQASHFKEGIILGSDGSGVVEEVGAETDAGWVGKEVIINPSYNWGNNPLVQGDGFKILGFPDAGTFAEYIAVPKDNVFEKPQHLSFAAAAALPLSGLTAYRALFSKARLRPGEKVLITGIGGGTAHWAMKLALAFNARVYVTSGSDEKIKKAIATGAAGGVNYRTPSEALEGEGTDWTQRLTKEAGWFDVIIDGSGGAQFAKLLEVAAPGARLVLYGRTAGTIDGIVPRSLFFKQISVFGTMLGTRDEFLSLIDFVDKHQLQPDIAATFTLDQAEAAVRSIEREDRYGKVILQFAAQP